MGSLTLIAKMVLCALVGAGFAQGKSDAATADATAEALRNLKESGVLKDIEQRLGDLLRDKEAEKQQQKKPFNWDEERVRQCDASKFVTTYAKEKGFDIGADLSAKLAEVQQQEGVGKAEHFEQLAEVVDAVVEKLREGSIDASALLAGNFAEHFASVGLLKKYMEKLEEEEKKKAKAGGTTLADNIRRFTRLAETNPMLVVNTFANSFARYGVVSQDTAKMVVDLSKGVFQSKEAMRFVSLGGEKLATLAESDGVEEVAVMLPLLATEEGRKELYDYALVESEEHLDTLVEEMTNSDLRGGFLVRAGEGVIEAYKYFFKDEMKVLMANAFLLSQGLPPLRTNDVVASSIDIVDKCLRLFTPFSVDLAPTRHHAKQLVEAFEKEYVRADEFARLDDAEQSKLVAQLLDDTLGATVGILLKANYRALNEGQLECAQSAICSMNEQARKQAVTKKKTRYGMSMMAGWAWSVSTGLDAEALYQAAHNGANSDKSCAELYNAPDCNVLQSKKGKMSLDFGRQEL